jgi:toxin ParE1/3/4
MPRPRVKTCIVWRLPSRTRRDATAERFIRRLIAKADSLSFMPERYRERQELQPGLRAVLVEKYLLFYLIDNRTVSIIRVLHGARDVTAEMFTR